MLYNDYIEIENDYLFKILLVGDIGVGKTSLLQMYVDNIFETQLHSTIGVELRIKQVDIEDKMIKCQLWELSGHASFKHMLKNYYKNTQGVIICFDICDLDTFRNAKNLVKEINFYCGKDVPKILVGNKADLKHFRQIDYEDVREFADINNIPYIEVSAKSDNNINEMFEKIIKDIKHDRKYCYLNSFHKVPETKLNTKCGTGCCFTARHECIIL